MSTESEQPMPATDPTAPAAEGEAPAASSENQPHNAPDAGTPAQPGPTGSAGVPSLDDMPSDAEVDREIAEALGGASLMDVMDAEEMAKRADRDTLHRATVETIQGDEIFVSLGAKASGYMSKSQFEGEAVPAIGDVIEVVVEGYQDDDGMLKVSRQGAVTQAIWRDIELGQILEGRVTKHNKGGLAMDFQGVSGFMPISQIERFRVDDISHYVDQRLQAEVIEVKRSEKAIVVSRRSLLEREAAVAKEKLIGTLAPGKVVQGVVKSIMPYGAFVDIGGVDGLLHVSDMAHSRIEDPRSVVTEGQNVELMVLKIDTEKNKISLGLKQVLPDPWREAGNQFPVDTIVSGRISKLMDFGAFVELQPGVEGLIPISEMTFERRINHPKEVVTEGEVVKLRVLNVDPDRKRISLSLKRMGEDPWMGAAVRWAPGSVITARVKRVQAFGAFCELVPGVEGLLHISELSHNRVQNVTEVVQEGEEVEAKVLSVDEDQRRISLSIKQRQEMPDYTQAVAAPVEPDPNKPKRKRPRRGGLDR